MRNSDIGLPRAPPQVDPTCVATGHYRPSIPAPYSHYSGAGATQLTLDAYKKFGQGFVTIGGGFMYAFGPTHGLVVNVGFLYMLPTSGVVFEPSIGYAIGL